MKKLNHQNAMIKLAVQEDVALNMALKGLLDIDSLLSKPLPEPTTINKKRSFIQFFKRTAELFGIL
jgi:hypothetical protein